MSRQINKFAIVSFEFVCMLASAGAMVLFSLLLNHVYVAFEATPFVIILYVLLQCVGMYYGFLFKFKHDGLTKVARVVTSAATFALFYGGTVGAFWITDHIRLQNGTYEVRDSVAMAHEDRDKHGYRVYKNAHIEPELSGEYIFDKYGDAEKSYEAVPVVEPNWKRSQAVTLWAIGIDMRERDWEKWSAPSSPIQGVLFRDKSGLRAVRAARKKHGLSASTQPVMLRLSDKPYEELVASSAAGTKWSMIIGAIIWCIGWLLVRSRWIK